MPKPELNDVGNAQLLLKRHGKHIRYVHSLKRWLIWDGRRWTSDETGQMMELAKETARSLLTEAAEIKDDYLRREVTRWANSSHSKARLEAMISLAQTDPLVAIRPDALDPDPMLLTFLNGTLELRTGTLRPHDPNDLITRLAPIEFDSQAEAPLWDVFLDRIFGGNQNLIGFMRRVCGYSLTGDTREQVLFVLCGTGANGKSTFTEAIRAILGEYAQHTPSETLLQQKNRTSSNDLARLRGARFVTAAETNAGARLAESLIKQVTGGEPVTARFLFAEFFEFKPQFKLFLTTNYPPRVEGTDHGLWRRLKLILFTETIPPEERIPDLTQQLEKELPGILNWAVQGCLEWQASGLQEPPEVQAAIQEYREESDPFIRFLNERCFIREGARVTSAELYDSYQAWCLGNSEAPRSQKWLAARLKAQDFQHGRTGQGAYWEGLSLVLDDGW